MGSRRAFCVITSIATALVAATSGASAVTSAASAAAATSQAVVLPGPVSQTPVSYTPNVFADGSCGAACQPSSTIYSTVVVNGEVVVAGAFTQVCAPAPASYAQCPNTVPADFLFAFDPATGAIDPHFTPVLDQGPVYALAAGPGNTVYAGGAFTSVNGTNAGGLAQLQVTPGSSSADGQLVPGFTGQANGTVTALQANGNALYVGGEFTQVDGKAAKVARLNATTGALDKSFKVTLADPADGQALKVKTMALTSDGSMLAIAGTFLTVNGQSIPRLALIDTGGALGRTATVANWSVPLLANSCSHQHDYVNGVDFSADGSFLVIADTGFQSVGGAGLCDAAARFETSATGSNVQPTWVNYSGGDSFHSVAVAGSVVYLGGHQRWANNECGSNSVCEANAVLVDGLTAADANTGLALPYWHPQTSRGDGVQSLTPFPAGTFPGSNGGLIIGTDASIIAGARHYELSILPMTTTTSPQPGGPIQSGMFSQGRPGGRDGSRQGPAALCIDDTSNSSAPGSPVELQTCINDNEQNWTITPKETIQINGLCLATQGGGTGNGTPVVADTCTGSTSQQWQQATGSTLVNQASGTCLDDPGASTTSGTQLQISTCNGFIEQAWPLPAAQAPPPPPPTGPVYPQEIQAHDGVPCMTAARNSPGTPVTLSTCNGNRGQNWTTEQNGTIQSRGLCLDTQGEGRNQGTPTVLSTCNGSTTQVWTPVPASNALVNQAAGICLDDPGAQTANGTQLQIWPCSGGKGQQYRLPTF
jgi:Ricin-type beta-trefoil lectin domain/Domain of unknown function (DUF5122) beta-propeller